MDKPFKRLEHRTVYRGRVLSLQVDRVIEPSGKEVEREVTRHSGASAVVASTGDDQLVLVRQFRYPVEEFLWEIPAGHIAPGERPEETARRELAEETGYTARRLEKLSAFYPSPGFSDEIMHLFLASQLEQGSPCPEEDEAIQVGLFSLGQVARMVSRGEVRDGKTLLGLLVLKGRKDPS